MRARALGLSLLLAGVAFASTPGVSAQVGPGGPSQSLLQVSLSVLTPPQEVPMLGQAVYQVTVEDRSADRVPDRDRHPGRLT
jgi:hypothetical protein